MSELSNELVNELVAACIAFGRQVEPDWQTRIETARVKLCEYIDEVEGLEEDSGSYDSLIPDWANEPKQHWIPVGERLPEVNEKVIALAKDCMNVDWVLPKELREVGKGAFARLYNVTHWMPLPKLPEVQE